MASLARTTLLRNTRTLASPRAFSTSIAARKSATETVKGAAKTVDRKVSDTLVSGIELGENAAHKIKDVAGVSSGEAKGKASEVAGKAKGKASELTGEAKGKANEAAGEFKGKA